MTKCLTNVEIGNENLIILSALSTSLTTFQNNGEQSFETFSLIKFTAESLSKWKDYHFYQGTHLQTQQYV